MKKDQILRSIAKMEECDEVRLKTAKDFSLSQSMRDALVGVCIARKLEIIQFLKDNGVSYDE